MFSRFIKKKAIGKKMLFVAMVLVLLVVFFSGCQFEPERFSNFPGELPSGLIGDWEFRIEGFFIDGYEIDGDTLAYISSFGEDDFGYKGNIAFVANFNATSGVIIIRYTEPPNYNIWDTDDPYYEDGYDYAAIYFRNLTATSVQMAKAINRSENSSPATKDIVSAIFKFTLSERGNYVAGWGTYSK